MTLTAGPFHLSGWRAELSAIETVLNTVAAQLVLLGEDDLSGTFNMLQGTRSRPNWKATVTTGGEMFAHQWVNLMRDAAGVAEWEFSSAYLNGRMPVLSQLQELRQSVGEVFPPNWLEATGLLTEYHDFRYDWNEFGNMVETRNIEQSNVFGHYTLGFQHEWMKAQSWWVYDDGDPHPTAYKEGFVTTLRGKRVVRFPSCVMSFSAFSLLFSNIRLIDGTEDGVGTENTVVTVDFDDSVSSFGFLLTGPSQVKADATFQELFELSGDAIGSITASPSTNYHITEVDTWPTLTEDFIGISCEDDSAAIPDGWPDDFDFDEVENTNKYVRLRYLRQSIWVVELLWRPGKQEEVQ